MGLCGMSGQIETIKINKVYENKYVTVFDNDVIFPSGTRGTYIRYQWKAPHSVGIVVEYNDKVLLLKNHRYGNKKPSYEIPMGFGTSSKKPFEDAVRELQEETGIETNNLQPFLLMGDDHPIYIFKLILHKNPSLNTSSMENTESIQSFTWIKKENITIQKMKEMNIINANTIASLFAWLDQVNNAELLVE